MELTRDKGIQIPIACIAVDLKFVLITFDWSYWYAIIDDKKGFSFYVNKFIYFLFRNKKFISYFVIFDINMTNYVSILEIQTDPTPNVQQLQEEIVKLRADLLIAKNTSIQQSSSTRSSSEAVSFASIKDNISLVNFYTGIQYASIFLWLLSLFKDEIKYTCW